MIWDDAEGRDELARMGLLPVEGRPERDGLATMALVGGEELGAFAGDAFSFRPFRRFRADRIGGKANGSPPRDKALFRPAGGPSREGRNRGPVLIPPPRVTRVAVVLTNFSESSPRRRRAGFRFVSGILCLGAQRGVP
jgi:hypothetical protein